ncbi:MULTISPECIES: SulP family inorganic anion transporter [Pseudoalteromonas]|uniref:SulP family inorganic anion transporter n=1 Tax=Pseudoalteromonas ruthenica TaxID=151081 RepID=A0A0F4PXU4_9GAMM|nr:MULTISPECIES: SulP family inorganic anion transporter [Pseudoalteromonas]KJY99106.1 sulfate permease [Pseudoalteromonas ruthenica]KJY99851.1 sulfate permease [Pseudoalteromonas ruthenica]MCF2861641.1 SulP family inorganic anion transporter [Pseudoalteromonas sp. CNAT2-18]MCG7557321.1 SulP family inorganic anion transporter [Pseudoalteromonas sp. CNAT2-18.1]MCG7564916.1 SulP family inorganic anion transporter [Pseudoalteromonas sp. CnMc7-15]|tara:strand:- start:2690 stop:4246 length:1557 start_codon:yes stop_codon:yes gene_type:complete
MFNLLSKAPSSAKNDILSGLTVALALVPEAVAFAFVAQVDPLVGLYAAFIVGLITSLLGGRPGMISGATGALAVVMTSLVVTHGVEYLFATVVLMGILQILAGVFKLGKFIRMVPHPVMLGFVNGLAIVIFLAQLGQFKVLGDDGQMQWMQGEMMATMLGLVALTMAIIHFLPKLTTAIPSSLAAIVVVTGLVLGLDLEARTVIDFVKDMTGDASATIAGGLPEFHIPQVPLNWETFQIILPYAVILAAIGLIESLLTLTLIDEITDTRGQSNKECMGQGAANLTCGFFGAMGGCAMIGQSMININSGGRSRLSGVTAALMLLAFILFAASYIEMVPLAALVGVMFMVVIGTFEWSSFRIMRKVPKSDAFVIFLVSAVTVATDLAIAVCVGIIVSALVFAWQHAKHIYTESYIDEEGSKVYELHGPLFFGSVKNFIELFDVKNDPKDVIVEFKHSRVADHSAIEAIDNLAEKYTKQGKTLHLRHVSPDCKQLLHKARDLVEINVIEDPKYRVASDKLG